MYQRNSRLTSPRSVVSENITITSSLKVNKSSSNLNSNQSNNNMGSVSDYFAGYSSQNRPRTQG